MTAVSVLFTGCALLCALAAFYAAWRAAKSEHNAEHTANRIVESRGRLVANEHAIEALDARLRALNGRVNQGLHRLPRKPPEPLDDDELVELPPPVGNGIDPDLAAAIALQTAPPVRPGS